MAGLCGLKILLLWAGIVSIANCQATAPTPGGDSGGGDSNHSVGGQTADPILTSTVTDTPTVTQIATTKPALTTTTYISNSPNPTTILTTMTDVLTLSPTRTKSTLPAMTSSSVNTSPPRTVTDTTTVTPTASPKPALTTPNTISNSPNPTTNLTTMTVTAPPTSTSPPPSSSPSPSPKPNQKITSQTNTTQTEPANTTITTTVTPAAPDPQHQQCSYIVTHMKFGFLINVSMNSTTNYTNYTINLNETNQMDKPISQTFNQSFHEVKHLKPCTEYELTLTFTDSAGDEQLCEAKSKNTTVGMSEDEVKVEVDDTCMPGYVCYLSDWDITSSLSPWYNVLTEQCKRDKKTFCIKPHYNDICTDLTTTFTSGNCLTSFNLTRSIHVDFLDSFEIKQTASTDFLAPIDAELPPNCTDLNVNYTCREVELNHTENRSDLKPFTDYSCSGQVKNGNVTVKNTTAVSFRIDCDFTLNFTSRTSTNKSIHLSWNTTSRKCGRVLPELKKLSYECSCSHKRSRKHVAAHWIGSERKCDVDALEPFTNYTCEVQTKYDGTVRQTDKVRKTTDIGKPEEVTSLTVETQDNNVLSVTCGHGKLHGNLERFTATLINGAGEPKKLKEETCKFVFKDLSYSTKYTVEVIVCNQKLCSEPKEKSATTSYNEKAVIGFLVFLIIITSVALLLVVYKIWILKRRKSHDLVESMRLISTANDEENLLSVEPIAAEILLDAYKRKLADEGRLFLAEFQSIPRIFSRYTVKEAKKSCNVPKNRYVDILPYDYNRVQLTTGNGDPGCDYINASFIDGYKESKKYIAAQGPKDETVSDFWRMVWEQQSSIIVMVTRCEEGNRVKCAQYWPSPDRETEIFEEFIVKLNSEDFCPDYTIRHLSLTNKREKNSEREVTHIQFMSWPDHGVPGEPHLLLKLRRRVNSFKNFFSGPIVIHCSAGVGRTGSYIGIDAMMEGLEAEGKVDIYSYVVKLRKQRCLMVQVEAQYILIHQALLEHNQFGETEITVSEIHSTLSTLKIKTTEYEPTLMQEEFERLPIYKNWRTFNTGITEENKKKNRSSSVIPYDYNRVLLKLDEGRSHDSDPSEEDEEESSDEESEESTVYVNASHIDGYWGPHALLAAQTPLPDTMADFWLMVYHKRASTIVMLSDYNEGDTESNCVYWDKDKKTFGDIEVELASTETSPSLIIRNMLIRHIKRKESRPVKQFQLLKWASGNLPEKAQDLTDMIKYIKKSSGSQKSQKSNPIVVHCNDGSSRSGIFCALWNLLDSAETEKLVDVFQVVKTLRKERQGMLSNLEQYQFLYEALEGVFPVQNGDVKAVQASACDSVQVVNETKADQQVAEEKVEQPDGTTNDNQQGEAETTPLVDEGGKEDKKEEPEIETTPLKDSTVTVEV
ncbi:receptor-type tyrosine-protein phosphatase C isoform X2 [Pungitius pungitius]|uniref:receptor-type tyrosine-protein phosphatase C isoform X2 n=1 Tax=Pungitius pungitius TaxID=134920 RepID=UPI002E0F83BE